MRRTRRTPRWHGIPELKASGPEALQIDAPPEQLRAAKSQLLLNAGLNEFAIRELEAEQGGQGANWATLMIARIYEDSGQNHRAIQFLKKAMPGYYSVDLAELPREYWEILFPRLYWTDLQREAAANSLDPYLVASLIRQESEFNPGAVSHADAYGLMQLLPRVGRDEARAAHIRRFSVASLLAPEHQHSTGHALLQRDGDAIQGAGGVRAGRLQCGFQPRG